MSRNVSPFPSVMMFFLLVFYFTLGVADGSGRLTNSFEVLIGFPLLVALCMRRLNGLFFDGRLVSLFFAYFIYYLLASFRLYPESPLEEILRFGSHGLLFFCAIVVAAQSDLVKRCPRLLAFLFVAGGSVLAVSSLVNFYFIQENVFNARLEPLGEARHPIVGMYYYGLIFWMALVSLFVAGGRGRAWAGMALVPLFLVFVFSFSRGPMLALFCTIAIYLSLRIPVRYTLGLAGLGGGLLVGLVAGNPERWVTDRGFSKRPEIWSSALELIAEKPWFGFGNDTRNIVLSNGDIGWHGHNIWVSHAYWGGAVAVFLLAAIWLRAVWLLWNKRQWPLAQVGLLQCCFGGVCLLTDGNIIFSSPGPLWIVFIVPVAIAASLPSLDKPFGCQADA